MGGHGYENPGRGSVTTLHCDLRQNLDFRATVAHLYDGGGLGKITLRISPALSKGPHATSHMLLTTRQDRAVISALETVTGDLAPGHEATMSQTRA